MPASSFNLMVKTLHLKTTPVSTSVAPQKGRDRREQCPYPQTFIRLKIVLSENFYPKIPNLGLKIPHFGGNVGSNSKF